MYVTFVSCGRLEQELRIECMTNQQQQNEKYIQNDKPPTEYRNQQTM